MIRWSPTMKEESQPQDFQPQSIYKKQTTKKSTCLFRQRVSRWLLLLARCGIRWRSKSSRPSTWSADVFFMFFTIQRNKSLYSFIYFFFETIMDLMGFCSRTVGANDLPKLEIDRKVMQYRRYEKLYPNSTCKEHCDAKKGLVPYLQVCYFLFSYIRLLLPLLMTPNTNIKDDDGERKRYEKTYKVVFYWISFII